MAIPSDPYSIKSSIVLMSSSHKGNFLLLEGGTDSKFYFKFIDDKSTMMVPCGNKKNVIDVSNMRFWITHPIFGIVDADFDCLDCVKKDQTYNDRIFLTDTHDIETLMLRTNAFDNLLNELADPILLENFEKKMKKSLVLILIDSVKKLGYFRLYNEVYQKNYDFRDINYLKFIDKTTLDCNFEKMIQTIKENSRNRYTDLAEISKFCQESDAKNYDPWIICNGHDLCHVLLIGLKYIFGESFLKSGKYELTFSNSDLEEIQSKLRMCYECNFFQKTQLYSKIRTSTLLNSICNPLKC